jgi:hypothetical protein
VGTLLHATIHMFLHNLLNALVQIANKTGLQKKRHSRSDLYHLLPYVQYAIKILST